MPKRLSGSPYRTLVIALPLLTLVPPTSATATTQDSGLVALTRDAVVARVFEHLGDRPKPLVLVVGAERFSPAVWRRVKNLIAFRLHRPLEEGTTQVDAATYLVRTSSVYMKAAEVLRNGLTNHEYIWCLLAAVLTHEAAHTKPDTEREALEAEAAQLRRCLFAGHLYSSSGWSSGDYLQKVEAKLRNPRQHH
jgi:hypothetical protein